MITSDYSVLNDALRDYPTYTSAVASVAGLEGGVIRTAINRSL